jgi:catechol-2,3-dioxygenase
MQCSIDHIVLNVEDNEKMVTFYSNVLMFAPPHVRIVVASKFK